jgi:hypothetical protein
MHIATPNEAVTLLRQLEQAGDLENAVFTDIPAAAYHHPDCPGVSSTQVKAAFAQSLAHFNKRDLQSDALRFGTALHCFVCEPDKFPELFDVVPDRGRAAIADRKTHITVSDVTRIVEMARSVTTHPDAADFFNDVGGKPQYELTFFSRDPESGILQKARVDLFKGDVIVDLKSTRDASPRGFPKEAAKYLYRISAAYYLQVVSRVVGRYLSDFYLVACEKEPPYLAAVYKVDPRSLSQADEEISIALDRIKTARSQGHNAWLGYPLGIQEVLI